jgi:tRNA-dihydrouridine synthase 2
MYINKLKMGIGDWGLGIGPNPQSPIPNFTEEIIAKKLRFCEKVYNPDLKTNDYLSTKEGTLVLRVDPISEKHKLILQIGASNPDDALQAALILKDDIVGVDVNMGCPKHFSTHGMMGSALLHNPSLAREV